MRKSHLTFRSELPRSGRLQRNSRSALRANLGLAEASDNTIQRECPKCDNFLKFFSILFIRNFQPPGYSPAYPRDIHNVQKWVVLAPSKDLLQNEARSVCVHISVGWGGQFDPKDHHRRKRI